MKTHFKVGRIEHVAACHLNGKRLTDNPLKVDCAFCARTPEFKAAEDAALIAKQQAFDAQEPRTIREPWHQEVVLMMCKACGHNLFRIGDRTCMGHYQDYVCARCGHAESRLTETGMSF